MSWRANKTVARWRRCHSAFLQARCPFCVHACSPYQPQWDSLICMRLTLARLSKCHSLCVCISQGWADPNTSGPQPWGCCITVGARWWHCCGADKGLDRQEQHLFRCVSNLPVVKLFGSNKRHDCRRSFSQQADKSLRGAVVYLCGWIHTVRFWRRGHFLRRGFMTL